MQKNNYKSFAQNNVLYPLISDENEKLQIYKERRSPYEFKTIEKENLQKYENSGWELYRENKSSNRIRKEKSHHTQFEDKVWCLLFKMGFDCLSGKNFKAEFDTPNGKKDRKQIDVFACDEQTVIIVECKSAETRTNRNLRAQIAEIANYKEGLRKSIFDVYRSQGKETPKILWILAVNNILLSKEDVERADSEAVQIFNQNQIGYYEQFIKHLGKPGRHQFLGEFFDGQRIHGLTGKKLPAIKGKIAGTDFYSFVISPYDLFPITFINHFTLDHPDGKPAYQRMVVSSRIKKIAKFIREEKGYFPTNILLNFKAQPKFELLSNKENTNENIKFGWITLPPKFRSAWIIDGQHRLFGYSHLTDEEQRKANLFVLAFDNMKVSEEAELFVKINSEQKSVPRSLLDSLSPSLKDNNPRNAITALAAGIFLRLNTQMDSPLYDRFVRHGIPPTEHQSLTLSEAIRGLKSSNVLGEIKGKNQRIDGFFTGTNDEETIAKTCHILNAYFEQLRKANPKAWEAGKAGYISTNPSIRAHLGMMREVITYLSHKRNITFALINSRDASAELIEFCKPVFNYFKEATSQEIHKNFSKKFGETGVKDYRFQLMEILVKFHPDFGPEKFHEWLSQDNSDEIQRTHDDILKFAQTITDTAIIGLKKIHGSAIMPSGEPKYWEKGVKSQQVRAKAYQKQQRDQSKYKKEAYLDILDIAEIVRDKDNWNHFERAFKNPMINETHGQKYYLKWLEKFNDIRNIAAHRNQAKTYSNEHLEFFAWLTENVIPKFQDVE